MLQLFIYRNFHKLLLFIIATFLVVNIVTNFPDIFFNSIYAQEYSTNVTILLNDTNFKIRPSEDIMEPITNIQKHLGYTDLCKYINEQAILNSPENAETTIKNIIKINTPAEGYLKQILKDQRLHAANWKGLLSVTVNYDIDIQHVTKIELKYLQSLYPK